jgi:hypothetical protein
MLEEAINSLPGELRDAVASRLRQRVFSQCDTAYSEARANGAANNSKEYSHVDGMGQMKASVPATAYHYWGQREGYDVWSDKKFVKRYLEDNPDVRVNSKSGKIQVGYRGDGFIPTGYGRKVKVYK